MILTSISIGKVLVVILTKWSLQWIHPKKCSTHARIDERRGRGEALLAEEYNSFVPLLFLTSSLHSQFTRVRGKGNGILNFDYFCLQKQCPHLNLLQIIPCPWFPSCDWSSKFHPPSQRRFNPLSSPSLTIVALFVCGDGKCMECRPQTARITTKLTGWTPEWERCRINRREEGRLEWKLREILIQKDLFQLSRYTVA